MSEWVRVAALSDLKRRRKLQVTVGTTEIALFLAGDKVYALYDVCIHKQRSLSKGTLFNGKVICPGHQWQFELETGWEDDQQQCQPSYPAKIDGDGVYVIPEPRPLATSAAGEPTGATAAE